MPPVVDAGGTVRLRSGPAAGPALGPLSAQIGAGLERVGDSAGVGVEGCGWSDADELWGAWAGPFPTRRDVIGRRPHARRERGVGGPGPAEPGRFKNVKSVCHHCCPVGLIWGVHRVAFPAGLGAEIGGLLADLVSGAGDEPGGFDDGLGVAAEGCCCGEEWIGDVVVHALSVPRRGPVCTCGERRLGSGATVRRTTNAVDRRRHPGGISGCFVGGAR